VKEYNKAVSKALGKIQENLETKMRNFDDIIQKQQEKLSEKIEEFEKISDELKPLSAIEKYMQDLITVTSEQKLELSKSNELLIEKLAQIKMSAETGNQNQVKPKLPVSAKLAIITGGSIISLAGLSYLIPQILKIAEWILNLF